MTEELRQWMRQQCFESLYFFLKVVLGFQDLTPSLHGQLTTYLQRRSQHKLIVFPRGHLKTSIGTIGYAIWRSIQDTNIRILIANATATNASHFVRAISAVFESNDLFRWLFPEVLPPTGAKWTETELELKRAKAWPEATIECIGVGGTVVSRHYNLIIEDDLLAPEDGFVSAELVQKTVEWHKYATSLLINPSVDEQVVIGTRWLYDDFIAYLFDNEKWYLPCLYKGAYKDGLPLWPERFPADVLDRILEQQGPRIFSSQYLNDPVHEDARSFDPSWFRFYTRFPPEDKLGQPVPIKCVTAIDPAISQKKHGDYSAIVTVATDLDRNRYVVDARRGRWGIDELIDHVFDVNRIWKPVKVGLETVMFQKALLWPFREAMRRENVQLPIVELRPSSRITKEGRIQSLHEFFANGSLWLNRLHTDLLTELRGWPAIAHDDVLDALAYAMQMLVYPVKTDSVGFYNTLTFEYIMASLREKKGGSPFMWPLGGKQGAVLGWNRIPQTREEIMEAMRASKE